MKKDQEKVKHLKYEKLELADYLQSNQDFIPQEIQFFLAKLQTRMVREIKCNFRKMHTNLYCGVCEKEECTQEHLLSCKKLMGTNEILSYIPEYNEIWEGNLEEKLYIANIMHTNLKKKKELEVNML